MAENTLETPSMFNLGMESAEYGNLQDAESFLSGTDIIEKIVPKKEEDKKEKEKEKVEKKETTTSKDVVEGFLEEGEEDDDEEGKEEKKTLKDAVNEEGEEDLAPLAIIAKDLYKIGAFTLEEGEEAPSIETPEDFLAILNKEGQIKATNWLEGFLSRFDENNNDLFTAIFVNGVSPRDYLATYSEMLDLEGLDLEIESNQEKVVRASLKEAGWPEASIDKKIERLKNSADLEEDAKSAAPILIERNKQELKDRSENESKKQEQKIRADIEYKNSLSTILNKKLIDKNIGGIPLSQKDASEVFDFLYSKKYKTASGELLTDFDVYIMDTKKPENHEDRIKIALLRKNKFDLSKIEKKGVSKEASTLFSGLKKDKEKKPLPKNTVWQ